MKRKNFLDNDQAIIEPAREKTDPYLGSWAIMVATPSELSSIVTYSHAEKIAKSSAYPFKLFTVKKENDYPIGLAGPFLGAPQGVIVMEKLIALGAKKIMVLGWCGSLQPDILIGDYIIPTSALSEEGTSRHYPVTKKNIGTSAFLNNKLDDMLGKSCIMANKGPIWTTDAIYRETENKVTAYSKKGILAVEMEMSALINLAAYRSVEMSGLLIVSDELFSLKWHHGFSGKKLKKKSIEAGRLLLNLCIDGG